MATATTLTIAIWFKLTEQRDWQLLLDLNGGAGGPRLFVTARGLLRAGAPLGIFAYLGASGHTAGKIGDVQNAMVGSWHHLVLTVDGTRARLYVDGRPRGEAATTITPAVIDPTQLVIGKSAYGSDPLLAATVDELAVWSLALGPAQVAALYGHQGAPRAGTFTTAAVDAGRAAPWRRLAWQTHLPAGKPLVTGTAEVAADYAGLADARERLGAPPRLLWPLDEADSVAPATFREVVAGRIATPQGTALSADRTGRDQWGLPGRAGSALALGAAYASSTSAGPYLSTQVLEAGPTTFSVGGWLAPTSGASGQLVAFVDTLTGMPSDRDLTQGRMLYLDVNGRARLGLVAGGARLTLLGADDLRDGQWHHLLASVTPTAATLFVDGAPVDQVALASPADPLMGAWRLGGNALAESSWPDWSYASPDLRMAEVGVWPRAIAADEARAMHQRGASTARLRVRTCAAAGCTDAPPWRGDGGGPAAFYSEAHNQVAGLVRAGAPDLDLALMAEGAPSPARFAQAQVRLDSWQTAATCGPAANEPCSAQVRSLSLGTTPAHLGPPAVDFQPTGTWFALDGLEEVLGAAGCPDGVTYNLQVESRTGWWAWLDNQWTSVTGTGSAASTAAELTGERLIRFGREVGRGAVTVRAFLGHADATHGCALKQVVLRGVAAGG